MTGIDDHSRFMVITQVVVEPSGRAVCQAFTDAMARYGVPSEVLTDNGKQFTGRFTKPFPAEVLFEKICRENGITARLTKPRSPTTTGKIERWHQSLRRELLDDCGRSNRCRQPKTRSRHGRTPTTTSGRTSRWA